MMFKMPARIAGLNKTVNGMQMILHAGATTFATIQSLRRPARL